MFSSRSFSPAKASKSTVTLNVFLLHATSGCDITTALFMQRKMKFLKTLLKNLHLANIKVLNDSNTTREIITVAEERFLESLYGYSGANVFSLNYWRHVSDKKSAFRHNSKIVALPPSAVAAQRISLGPAIVVGWKKGWRVEIEKNKHMLWACFHCTNPCCVDVCILQMQKELPTK